MAYRRRHSSSVLNLTPLIDIVFLLLVFFMLTAHFVEDETVIIDLPEAASGQPLREDPYVNVVIDASGRIQFQGQSITESALKDRLIEALALPDKRIVRLRGDTESRFGLAVKVIDISRSAGAESVDIVTQRP